MSGCTSDWQSRARRTGFCQPRPSPATQETAVEQQRVGSFLAKAADPRYSIETLDRISRDFEIDPTQLPTESTIQQAFGAVCCRRLKEAGLIQ